MLALCWLMLALCWLMLDQVGSSWLMSAQVGPSWPQDASMLAQNPRKSPEHTSQGLQEANFLQFLIENCSFSSTLDLENIEKSICFIGPFAICTFLFLLMLFGSLSWLKFAPSWLMLAYLSKFEAKLSQVGTKLAQDGSKLDPRWFHVGSSWVHVRPKLAPSWLKLSPSVPQRRSRRAWRFSYTLLGGSWKSPGGHQEPRAPKLFPKASKSTKN